MFMEIIFLVHACQNAPVVGVISKYLCSFGIPHKKENSFGNRKKIQAPALYIL